MRTFYGAIVFLLLIFLCPLEGIGRDPVVKVVYFQSTDVEDPDEGELQRYRQVMKDLQRYYQDQMIKHGHGPKTFSLDLLPSGDVNVVIVRGRKQVVEYKTVRQIDDDIPLEHRVKIGDIDLIQVIFLAGALEFDGGWGWAFDICLGNDCRHLCIIPTDRKGFLLQILAHEIGHAFGLGHNRKAGLMMHPEIHTPAPGRIEGHEAHMLDRHKYFVRFPILQAPVGKVETPKIMTKDEVSDEDLRVHQEDKMSTLKSKGPHTLGNLRVDQEHKLTTLWAELKAR